MERAVLTTVGVVAAVSALLPLVSAACWLNEQITLSSRGSRNIYYFTSCYDSTTTYYSGDYSIQTVTADKYSVRYGDQLCGTDPQDISYYSYLEDSYANSFINTNSWTYSGSYSSYFPKLEVVCNDLVGDCQLQGDFCMYVYALDKANGTTVKLDDDDCKPVMVTVDTDSNNYQRKTVTPMRKVAEKK